MRDGIPESDEESLQLSLSQFRATPEGVALEDYLKLTNTRGVQPPVKVFSADLGVLPGSLTNAPNGAKPMGIYGIGNSSAGGMVVVDPSTLNRNRVTVGTLAHEFTHAAQDRMSKQVNGPASSPQFKQAYRKLGLDGEALAKAVSSKWVQQDRQQSGSRYRTTQPEITAFGVGNSMITPQGATHRSNIYGGPDHLDATAAQEFMILLDLATRELRKPNK